MQIDLLVSPRGESGLVSNANFDNPVSGIIFDVNESSLTLEFAKSMDSLKLNVPVSDDFVEGLKRAQYMHICAVEKGRLVYAAQVALIKVSNDEDDTFYSGEGARGVMPLQTWMRESRFAQSIHRDDLGKTSSNGGIMHREGLSRATLQVAPQLAQQLVKEQALAQKAQLQNTPRMAPPSLGPGTQGPQINLGRGPRGPDGGQSDENKG